MISGSNWVKQNCWTVICRPLIFAISRIASGWRWPYRDEAGRFHGACRWKHPFSIFVLHKEPIYIERKVSVCMNSIIPVSTDRLCFPMMPMYLLSARNTKTAFFVSSFQIRYAGCRQHADGIVVYWYFSQLFNRPSRKGFVLSSWNQEKINLIKKGSFIHP